MALKVCSCNIVNKSDDMINKAELVHFKTRVVNFALVWEIRLPSLLVIILIFGVWSEL